MTPEKRKEAHRARIRATYHWYKAHGICIACGHEDVEPGKTRCAECAMKAAARDRAAYYRQREERREAMRRRKRELYAKHRAKGLCANCGKKTSAGKRLYLDCFLRRRRYDKRYFDAYRRVKTNFSDGLCRLCNEPVVTGKKLCARHCAIAKKNLKKANAQQSNADHPWRHGNQLIFKKRDTQ